MTLAFEHLGLMPKKQSDLNEFSEDIINLSLFLKKKSQNHMNPLCFSRFTKSCLIKFTDKN